MTVTPIIAPDQLALVKATAPAVKENGVAITTRFYERLFEHHPETKSFFEGAAPGQEERLASAIVAYVDNIDDLTPVQPVVRAIARKHVAAGVQPEHYDVVGSELLAAVVDVLGELPDDVVAAWASAYGVLAGLFIEIETELSEAA